MNKPKNPTLAEIAAMPVGDSSAMRSFYKAHNRVTYKGDYVCPHTGEVTTPTRRVKQQFKAECDINNIIKEFSQTGQVRHISAKAQQGQFLDLPDDLDFQNALDTVRQGNEAFAALPSHVRDRFLNDPQQFLLFMADPANQDEIIKLGLATDKRPPPPKPEVPPAPAPAAPAAT